jgi:hypothetical protein
MTDRRLLVLLVFGALIGCDDSTGPEERLDTELTFVRPAGDAPPLATITQSLLVTRGQNSEIRMFYRSRPGRNDSTEFLRLKFDSRTLLRRPDGTQIQDGESVLVTVTAVNIATRLEVNLEPAGLRFDPNRPAELKIEFDEADHDFDEDGVTGDSDDDRIEAQLGIWRRETELDPWTRLSTRIRVDDDDVEADLTGFSNYALAF